jgi:hypothetical protein
MRLNSTAVARIGKKTKHSTGNQLILARNATEAHTQILW